MASFIFDQWQAAMLYAGPDLSSEYDTGVVTGGLHVALIKSGTYSNGWTPASPWIGPSQAVWDAVLTLGIYDEVGTAGTGYTQHGQALTSNGGTDPHPEVDRAGNVVALKGDNSVWTPVTFTESGATQGPRYALLYWRHPSDMDMCIPVALFDFEETITVDNAVFTIAWQDEELVRCTSGTGSSRIFPGFIEDAMLGLVDMDTDDCVVRIIAFAQHDNIPANTTKYWTPTHTANLEHAEGGSGYTRGDESLPSFEWKGATQAGWTRYNNWGPEVTDPHVDWGPSTMHARSLVITNQDIEDPASAGDFLIVATINFGETSSGGGTFRVTWHVDGIMATDIFYSG